MNRETKRMMQRQGQMEADGSPASRRQPAPRGKPQPKERVPLGGRIAGFFREVRSELRQVAWPTRPEVVNSSSVVLITLVLLVGLIFLLNLAFSHGVTFLFKT